MKTRILHMAGLMLLFYGCNKDNVVPVPATGPVSVMTETYPLPPASKLLLEGVYRVTSGSDKFGDLMVVKWNRTGVLFANNNGKHFIMEAGHLDSVVFIQGYWRDGYSDATGACTMIVGRSEGGTSLVTGNGAQQIIIRGAYAKESGLPDQTLTMEYLRPFSDKVKNSNFYILGHRAGGRNSDRLPVSENSLAMIKYTERLGTTGIEVDPRLSSDKIPFIYHDPDINIRLTQKGPLAGDVSAYTWRQLSSFVRLIHGEKIPSLQEVLNYVVDSTSLRFVYLDMKTAEAVPIIIPMQLKALQRAKDNHRKDSLLIVMGIPSTEVLNAVLAYPGYQNVPTLCELTVDDVRQLNSKVWAPRWTLGTQNDLVQQMQNEGRLAVCWTIDSPGWIETYLNDGLFNGLLTNYPYVVAYYHYIQE
ncbi:MAG: glycerophosphodiester phosphodiesterase family protein [Bacteroidetes bacterium]|nr:glycerophosphodiester phosphodiesterase family protein [Bacteroidota bacterium]